MSYASSSGAMPCVGIPDHMLREHIAVLEEQLACLLPHEPRRRQLEDEIRTVQMQIRPSAPPAPPPPLPSVLYSAYQPPYRSMSCGGTSTASSSKNSESWSWSGDGSKKRQRDSPGGVDRAKSPRYTPSPATTFASTPANGSPGKENLGNIGFDYLDDYSYLDDPVDEAEQMMSDEQYARMLQQQYNDGWSPSSGQKTQHAPPRETDGIPNVNTAPSYGHIGSGRPRQEPESPTPFNGIRGDEEETGVVDSEEEAGSEMFRDAESEESGSRSDSVAFLNPPNQQQALSNEEFIREVGFNPDIVQPTQYGFDEGNLNWLSAPFLDISGGGYGVSTEMPALLDTSNQIVDASGNVVVNGGWQMPGSFYPAPCRMMPLPAAVHSYASYVRNDPTKTHQEIRSLLENIRPDMEIPPENREGTPDAMVYPLMEHQKLGLAWLKKMEESKTKGGILADDMGLGKTIQALALIVSRPSTDPKRKTTLIVAPVALLKQWQSEIQKKLKPDYKLSTYIHHGNSKKSRKFADLRKYDVVLTTYGTIASEFKQQEKHKEGKSTTEPKLVMLAEDARWYRVILDESQWIKTRTVQCSKGCWKLDSIYRLCLSGTPMQNSCDELYPLLRFLRVKPYSEWDNFSMAQISRPLKNKSSISVDRAMARLQALLGAILLRRTKDSQIDGKPILSLPPKTVQVIHAVFSAEEQEFYNLLESRSKIQFNKYLRANAVGKNYSNVLVLLLRLRQACCHPHLISDIEEHSSSDVGNPMLKIAKELPEEAVNRIKEEMGSSECPVCFDVSENPSIIVPCGHLFCSECLVKVQTQHNQSLAAQGEGAGARARCPGCRGELDMNKIIDLNTFKNIFQPDGDENDADKLLADMRPDDGLIYDTDPDDSDEDDDVNEKGDLKDFVVPDDEDEEAEVRPKPKVKKAKSDKSKEKGKRKAGVGRTLAEIRKDAMKNEKSKRRYHKYLAGRWVDSAKVTKCMDILNTIRRNDPAEKTIIFSQFTSLLDLLEVPMAKEGIAYRRYDGGMSSAKRDKSIEDFSYEDDVKVLLVSLKAGNSGLNLVSASQVIIFDPFYNPFVELQAIDRAHRIGQQRPVIVHRLIVENTVEDRVLQLQDKKRALIEGALDENAQRGIGRLSVKDLGFLFGI